jgi:hypothetical protein
MDRKTSTERQSTVSLWTRARFPNAGARGEFFEQIQLWNRMEDVPKIQARKATNHTDVDYWCADYRRIGLRKLVESYGGRMISEPVGSAQFEQQWVA